MDQLVNTFNGQEEHESWTQGQQELVWKVETYCEEHKDEVCEAQSEIVIEDHYPRAQELVTPPKEPTQCEDEVGSTTKKLT